MSSSECAWSSSRIEFIGPLSFVACNPLAILEDRCFEKEAMVISLSFGAHAAPRSLFATFESPSIIAV